MSVDRKQAHKHVRSRNNCLFSECHAMVSTDDDGQGGDGRCLGYFPRQNNTLR